MITKKILLLRLSYWTAAIADFIIAFVTWIPERMGTAEINYPMGLASVIAFSWGIILLIADRQPVERKWILIPTILVVTLITLVRTWFSLNGTVEFNTGLFLFALVLIALMAYSYSLASKPETGC